MAITWPWTKGRRLEQALIDATHHFRTRRSDVSEFCIKILGGAKPHEIRMRERYLYFKLAASVFRCDTAINLIQLWNATTGKWEIMTFHSSNDPHWGEVIPQGGDNVVIDFN